VLKLTRCVWPLTGVNLFRPLRTSCPLRLASPTVAYALQTVHVPAGWPLFVRSLPQCLDLRPAAAALGPTRSLSVSRHLAAGRAAGRPAKPPLSEPDAQTAALTFGREWDPPLRPTARQQCADKWRVCARSACGPDSPRQVDIPLRLRA
jgi:hypothetical protein